MAARWKKSRRFEKNPAETTVFTLHLYSYYYKTVAKRGDGKQAVRHKIIKPEGYEPYRGSSTKFRQAIFAG
jgi:hypothetical protein